MLDYDEQDGEVLENVDLQQSFRQRIMNKRKSKLARHANSKMLPLLDDEEDDEVDGWRDPSETIPNLLNKYDDVEDLALKKKRANRMQVGAKVTGAQSNEKESKAKAREEITFEKRKIGSDYYATNEEDPLLSGYDNQGRFKSKKGLAGSKRTRLNPLALTNNMEEDIVSVLEVSAQN